MGSLRLWQQQPTVLFPRRQRARHSAGEIRRRFLHRPILDPPGVLSRRQTLEHNNDSKFHDCYAKRNPQSRSHRPETHRCNIQSTTIINSHQRLAKRHLNIRHHKRRANLLIKNSSSGASHHQRRRRSSRHRRQNRQQQRHQQQQQQQRQQRPRHNPPGCRHRSRRRRRRHGRLNRRLGLPLAASSPQPQPQLRRPKERS
jgi:hypothetical protein